MYAIIPAFNCTSRGFVYLYIYTRLCSSEIMIVFSHFVVMICLSSAKSDIYSLGSCVSFL